jgi:hypothetical protein
MTTQAMLWILAGCAAALTVFAGFAERRRTQRRNLDKPGWVPWDVIQILGGILVVVAIVLALKA